MPGRGEPGRCPAPEKAPYGARRAVESRGFAQRRRHPPPVASPLLPPPKATETTAREEGKVTPAPAGISPGAVMTPSRGAITRSLRRRVPAAAAALSV